MTANLDLVIVNIGRKTPMIWTFIDTMEEAPAKIAEYEERDRKDLVLFAEYAEKYDRDYWTARIEEVKKYRYAAMTFDEYRETERKALTFQPIEEITEERFEDMLNVLPPLYWGTYNGISQFCMSEMWTGTYTTQYARVNGRYFCTMVDITDRSTWIHNRLAEIPEMQK